jgi:hypothetical protein
VGDVCVAESLKRAVTAQTPRFKGYGATNVGLVPVWTLFQIFQPLCEPVVVYLVE